MRLDCSAPWASSSPLPIPSSSNAPLHSEHVLKCHVTRLCEDRHTDKRLWNGWNGKLRERSCRKWSFVLINKNLRIDLCDIVCLSVRACVVRHNTPNAAVCAALSPWFCPFHCISIRTCRSQYVYHVYFPIDLLWTHPSGMFYIAFNGWTMPIFCIAAV